MCLKTKKWKICPGKKVRKNHNPREVKTTITKNMSKIFWETNL